MTFLAAEPLSDAASLLRGAVELCDEIRAASEDGARLDMEGQPGNEDADVRRILAAGLRVFEACGGETMLSPSTQDLGQFCEVMRREALDQLGDGAAGVFLLALALELEPAQRRREARNVSRRLGAPPLRQ